MLLRLMAHRVARQLKGRTPDVPSVLTPELFDLLCEMRLQLAAQQKQHAQLRHEISSEIANLWRAVLSGGVSKSFPVVGPWQASKLAAPASSAFACSILGGHHQPRLRT